jgi:predicted Zn-dependent protease
MFKQMFFGLALACALCVARAETPSPECTRDPLRFAQLAEADADAVHEYQARWGRHEPSARMHDVLHRLLQAADGDEVRIRSFDWRLAGYRHDVLNAHATVTGRLLVSSGLDDAAVSDDTLAVVLAHEIGHVVLGHGIRMACFALASVNPALALRVAQADFAAETWSPGTPLRQQASELSQRFEVEADDFAVRLAHRAGYDPRALANLFSAQAHGQSEAFARGTHPELAARAARAAAAAYAQTAPR